MGYREIVHSYRYSDDWRKHGDGPQYGFELELDFMSESKADSVTALIEKTISKDEMLISFDSSLNNHGIELRSHMFSIDAMREFVFTKIKPVMDLFSKSDLSRSKNVGVHVSLNFDDIPSEHRKSSCAKFSWFINTFQEFWEALSNRSGNGYCNYRQHSDLRENHDKFSAVNVGNTYSSNSYSGRVEVRTFYTTNDPNTLMAYIDVCHQLKLYSVSLTMEGKKIKEDGIGGFLGWLEINDMTAFKYVMDKAKPCLK